MFRVPVARIDEREGQFGDLGLSTLRDREPIPEDLGTINEPDENDEVLEEAWSGTETGESAPEEKDSPLNDNLRKKVEDGIMKCKMQVVPPVLCPP